MPYQGGVESVMIANKIIVAIFSDFFAIFFLIIQEDVDCPNIFCAVFMDLYLPASQSSSRDCKEFM